MVNWKGMVFMFEQIMNNNWVISLLTGLTATVLIDFFKSIKKRKEYVNRIELVEDEFLTFLKSLIVQNEQPESKSIQRYLNGVAIKYKVKFDDVSNIEGIINKLTKDILDSQFLNFDKKLAFCLKVEELFSLYNSSIDTNATTNESKTELYFKLNFYRYRRLQSFLITFLFSFSSILMLLWYRESKILFDSGIKFNFNEREGSVFFYIISMSILILSYYLFDKRRTSKRIRDRHNHEDVKNT